MTQPQPVKTWIPVDVKIHWFSFLSAEDLSRASRVCKPWASLVQKTSEVLVATTIGAPCPNLSRAGKLLLLRRLQNATKKENMGYLLAWAAGCREYTPFLHKLLLLRDALREDCGLPGGLHESARPDAYAEVDEEVRALFTYRTGPAVAPPGSPSGELPPGVDLVATPPLVVAAQRGNVDALNLLLLFGEGVGARRKNYLEKALYAAAEQGNVASVACLLGRIPLRPPSHPHHIARTLGLLRPTFPVYGPGNTYSPGVAIGPRSVAAAIAGAKMRAETASATGSVTGANGTVRASMSNAMSLAEKRKGGGGSGSSSGSNSRFTAFFSPVEAQVVTMEVCEADGRYREWCKGYFMGGYWSCYDTSLANWEALHGALGGALEVLGSIEPTPAAGGGGGEGAPPVDPVAAALAAGDAAAVAAAAAEVVFPNGAPPLPPKKRHTKAAELTLLGATTLANLPQRLQRCIAPGSTVGGSTVGVTPPYATTALIVSRLPPNLPLSLAVRPRKAGHIPPPIPPPIDYGRIAAEVVGIKVRLNTGGPVEGRTPLNVAVERGRLEIALLLLSHADPGCVERGDIPQLLNREGGGGGEGGAGEGQQQQGQQQQQAGAGQPAAGAAGGAAPAAAAAAPLAAGGGGGGGNPALQGGAAAPPPLTGTALLVSKARRALSDLAAMNSSALAVSYGDLAGSPARREELFSELMETRRDVADPDASPSGYHTPLCLACLRGDDRLVGLLLHWGADVNKEGKKEARPLLCAAMGGHEHILRLLLRVTCDPQESRKVLEQVERLSLRFGGNGSTALAITPAPSTVEWWNPASSSNRGGGASSPRGGFSLSGEPSPIDTALRLVPYRGGRVVCTDKVESVAVEEAVKGTPLIGPRCIPYATPLAAQHILLPPAMNTGLEGFTQSLGLGVNAASVLDLALLRTRKERGEEKTTGGTAASNAMGSTVAAQSGRGGGRGGGGGGGMSSGGGGGDEDLAKPEDTPLDTAEPTITLLLAALASGTPGAIDDLGLPLIGKPSPYDASLYLPCEEAQLLPPTALSFVDIACMLQGVPTPSAVVAASAGSRPKPLTFAQRALGKGAAGGGGGSEEDGGGTTPLVHPDAIGGGLTIANITAVAGNSFPSYLALSVAQARLKMALRSTAHWLLSKSRVLQGCGNTPGRGAPLMVDVGDESGYSALFVLACAGKLESVALLVSAGADCCAMTKRGKTPIYGAVEKGHTDVVEWLLTKYTANQLRANTTYGTNVLHAAQKAGNSRIKDLVQTYCVEYDVREARKLKQERESNKANDGEEAANHMKKLRAMAEAAKKREEDSKLGRRWGASGGGGGEGGDEDRPHSASRRGRSVEPKLLTPAAASASALVSAARSASVAPAAKSSQHRAAGGGGATPLPPIGVLRGRSMGGEGQDVATPSSRAGSADSRKASSSSSSGGGGGGANAKGGNGMRSVSAARRNASEGGKVVGGGVPSSGGSNKPPTSRPPPASSSAPAPSSPRPGFPSTAAMAGGGGGGGASSPKAKFTASLPPSLASLLTQSAMEESRAASSIAAASHSQVVAPPPHSPLSPPPASSTTAAAAANSSSSSSFNALNTSLPGSTSRLVLSPEATHTAPSSSTSSGGGGGGGGAAGSSPSSVYDRLMGKAKELEQKRKSAEEELVKKAQAQASTNGMTSKAGMIPAAVVAVTAATSPPPSTSTHHAYPPRGGSAGAAAPSMGGLTLEGSALVGGNGSGGAVGGGGLIPVAAKVVSVSKPTLTPAAAAAAAAAALVAGAASKLSSASARIQPEVPSAATRGRRVSTTSSTPTSRGSSEGVAAPRIPGLKLGNTASTSKPLAIIPPSLAPPSSSSAPATTTIKSTPSSPSKSGSGKATFSSGADVRAAARSENATAPTMSTAEEVRSKRSAFLEKLGAVVSSTTTTITSASGGGDDAATATAKGGSARAPSPMRAPATTTPSAFSAGEQAMATAAALRLKRLEGSMNAAPGSSSEDITSSSSSAAAAAAATFSSSSTLSVLESMGAAPGSPVARVLAAAKVQIGEGAKRRSAAAAAAAASSSSGNSSSTSSKSAMLGAALGLSLGATGTALSLRALPTPPPLPTREEISARDERIRQREEKAAATRNAAAAAKAAEAEAAAKALAVSNMVNSLKSAVSLYGGGKAKAKASNF